MDHFPIGQSLQAHHGSTCYGYGSQFWQTKRQNVRVPGISDPHPRNALRVTNEAPRKTRRRVLHIDDTSLWNTQVGMGQNPGT